jgi:hypothetical protein
MIAARIVATLVLGQSNVDYVYYHHQQLQPTRATGSRQHSAKAVAPALRLAQVDAADC